MEEATINDTAMFEAESHLLLLVAGPQSLVSQNYPTLNLAKLQCLAVPARGAQSTQIRCAF